MGKQQVAIAKLSLNLARLYLYARLLCHCRTMQYQVPARLLIEKQ